MAIIEKPTIASGREERIPKKIEKDAKEELKTQEYRIDKKTIKTKTNPPPEE